MTGADQAGVPALREQIARAARAVGAPEDFVPTLERPRDPDHGDWSSNAALVLAKRLGAAPRDLAQRIASDLDREAAAVSSVEVAGPGFLNFRLSDRLVWDRLREIIEADGGWGRTEPAHPERINVEFVSANPTGPLHVAHGRGAAYGDAVASLLTWAGHEVSREFYVNDAGRQIELLAESVDARFREGRGEEVEIPEGGYHGSYVSQLARDIADDVGAEALAALSPAERLARFRDEAVERLRSEQARDLEDFGVHIDTWFSETALHEDGAVDALLEELRARGLVYTEAGASWIRTSEFGDEKDRVLVKSDGLPTYFAPDLAYHLDKARRGFERTIDVWGADHQGHEQRMLAALRALGHPDLLEVLILQLVTVMRGGEEARMSKRAGRFVTLRQLFDETGADVARYFFLMRRAEQNLNFDLDLALDTSDANPVYKVQYAHARLCSVFAKAGLAMDAVTGDEGLDTLDTEAERTVATLAYRLPEVLRSAARVRAPHIVCSYLEELAGAVNHWYHQGNLDPELRVLAEGPARDGRLALARAAAIALRNGLASIGLGAPERLERDEDGGA